VKSARKLAPEKGAKKPARPMLKAFFQLRLRVSGSSSAPAGKVRRTLPTPARNATQEALV
jgi:hypothetical protein